MFIRTRRYDWGCRHDMAFATRYSTISWNTKPIKSFRQRASNSIKYKILANLETFSFDKKSYFNIYNEKNFQFLRAIHCWRHVVVVTYSKRNRHRIEVSPFFRPIAINRFCFGYGTVGWVVRFCNEISYYCGLLFYTALLLPTRNPLFTTVLENFHHANSKL